MKTFIFRTNSSIFSRWWWSIDIPLLSAILLLYIVGLLIMFSASSSVAQLNNLHHNFFFIKQSIIMIFAILFMIIISFLSTKFIRRLSILGLLITIIILILTPLIGQEIKGATRWINIFGFTFQISEYTKPLFAIISGWLFATHFKNKNIPGVWISLSLCIFIIILFMLQPDFGQSILLLSIFLSQFIVSGISLALIIIITILVFIFSFITYLIFPHVQDRINKWLFPNENDTHQIERTLEAFSEGGFFGVGLGNGKIKNYIPDVHADFVFAVVGEEGGLIFSLLVLAIFLFIIYKIIHNILIQDSLFMMFSLTGLCTLFSVQTIINLSSTIGLIPSKGMTLPFVSYGGSSLIAMSGAMGVILSFTRKKKEYE